MTTMKSILSRLTQAVSGTDKELFNEKELNQFASFYLDKWDKNTSEDVVAESFVDYWWNTSRACRRCSEKVIAEIETASALSIAHYDMRFLKPLDEALLEENCFRFVLIIELIL